MNLSYIATEKGYTIFNDGKAWIEQDGFFPYPGATTADKAQVHINAIIAGQEDASKIIPIETQIAQLEADVATANYALMMGGLI